MEQGASPCPACGHPNPMVNRFCGACGAPLPAICPACGAGNPAENRFCGMCGITLSQSSPGQTLAAGPLAPSRTVVRDKERRLVTILFADVVDSTTLGEMLDPELVDEVIGTAQGALAEVAARYEGHVAKYLGDGIMVLFGAPIAHEDDPERAVRAGLEMQGAMEALDDRPGFGTGWSAPDTLPLQIRVGITSGEVVAGDIAGSYDVIGDAANTSARLQSAADPGEVLVDEETMYLASRIIRFGARRQLSLKGKMEKVAAYPALGRQERMMERWEGRDRRTPLIGRDRELQILLDAWSRARRGEGQLVTVVGEGGFGKSRLLAEAVERISTEGSVKVLRGRCLSYGQHLSLWLVADLIRDLCGIRESDRPDRAAALLADCVSSLLAAHNPEVRDGAVDVLGTVLGLVPSQSIVTTSRPQDRRQILVHSLRHLVRAVAAQTPSIVILEDLHWSDAASIEVLGEILADVPQSSVLVLTAHRTDSSAPWDVWDWTMRIELPPLNERQSALLARAILNGSQPSTALQRYLDEHAGGNPYFIEEMLRTLDETAGLLERDAQVDLAHGAVERLPNTLTEMLEARLDRLETRARDLAQVASVLGRSFRVSLLAHLVSEEQDTLELLLATLQQAEIAFPHPGSNLEYAFKNASLHDVVYRTLMHRRRQALHAAAAEALSALSNAEEYVEMIAHHYSQTEEHAQATTWLERAGDRAALMYANDAAIEHYRAARERLHVSSLPAGATGEDVLARLDSKLGAVLTTVGRYGEALEALERAAETYHHAGDQENLGAVTAQIGLVHADRGTPHDGIARLESLAHTLEPHGPSPALSALYAVLARLFFTSGSYEAHLSAAERASQLARALGDERLLAEAEVWRGTALSELGRHDDALPVLEEAIPLAESIGDLDALERALAYVAGIYRFAGELEQSRIYLERSLELAQRRGDPSAIEFALADLGEVVFYLGDWPQARLYCQKAVELMRLSGASWSSAYPLLRLGQICLAEGSWDDASRYLTESIAIAEHSQDLQASRWSHQLLAEKDLLEGHAEAALARLQPLLDRPGLEEEDVTPLLPVLARASLQRGDDTRAVELAAQAVARARSQSDRFDLVEALRIEAHLIARREADGEAARSRMEEALTWARCMHYPYGEARVLEEYGQMLLERGEDAPGRKHQEAALTIFRRLGARRDAERVEQALMA